LTTRCSGANHSYTRTYRSASTREINIAEVLTAAAAAAVVVVVVVVVLVIVVIVGCLLLNYDKSKVHAGKRNSYMQHTVA